MNDIDIFSDGACSNNPGIGGWCSIIHINGDKIIHVGCDEDTTNNRMELKGFISALEMALNTIDSYPMASIKIHTDAKYVENPINLGWINRWTKNGFLKIKNADLWAQVAALLRMLTVTVLWIPRELNEEADSYAKRARDGVYGRRATIAA